MSIKKISLLILAVAIGFIFILNKNKNNSQNKAFIKLTDTETIVEEGDVDAEENEKATNSFAQFANLSNQSVPPQKSKYAALQGGLDFTEAAGIATPAVVHIKTKVLQKANNQRRNYPNNPFFDLFGDDLRDMFGDPNGGNGNNGQFRGGGSGSGVIISSDGYIVSNNHVVSAGDEIEVILHDKKKYKAEVIGTDKSTDIALIKIDETNLPFLNFSNSDDVRVGEWVLAVGNPFSLASTVTAGIVSAKARNIDILDGESAIESFIQTDAAVNPGNSGGALVNLRGDLIGINTAIATPTGTFAGYSFAVPSNLVAKIIDDLKEYGVAQRGYIGVRIRNVSNLEEAAKKEYNINESEGVFVEEAMAGSGAAEAGLQPGDIIVEVNNKNVSSMPELQESVATFRPGDKVGLTYIRDKKRYNTNVVLKNANQNLERVTKSTVAKKYNRTLGAELEVVSDGFKEKLGISGGVQITDIRNGLLNATDIKEGFIITKIQNDEVYNISDIDQILQNQKGRGGVMIEGIYPNNPYQTIFYAFGM